MEVSWWDSSLRGGYLPFLDFLFASLIGLADLLLTLFLPVYLTNTLIGLDGGDVDQYIVPASAVSAALEPDSLES